MRRAVPGGGGWGGSFCLPRLPPTPSSSVAGMGKQGAGFFLQKLILSCFQLDTVVPSLLHTHTSKLALLFSHLISFYFHLYLFQRISASFFPLLASLERHVSLNALMILFVFK